MKIRELGIIVRNTILGGNVESLFALADPRRTAYYHTECRFLYKCIFPKREFVQKPVWEMFGADRVSVVLYPEAAQEWFRPVASYTADLVSMCMLCQLLRPKTILEIGTYNGAGALHWAGNALEAEIYTLDLPSATAPQLPTTEVDRAFVTGHAAAKHMFFEGRSESKRIHPIFGDSATFDFSPLFGKVDLLFIDGAHSYEYVRNDTLRGMKCCNPGSIIAWHDYGRVGFNGVSKWLHEFSQQSKTIYRVPGGSLAYTQL
jgi:predicted O-methyltransferase YrrM